MNVRLAAVTTILVLLLGPIRFVTGEQFFPDVITTKSGEKIEGRITAESGESVTVSIETSTSRRDRVISPGRNADSKADKTETAERAIARQEMGLRQRRSSGAPQREYESNRPGISSQRRILLSAPLGTGFKTLRCQLWPGRPRA